MCKAHSANLRYSTTARLPPGCIKLSGPVIFYVRRSPWISSASASVSREFVSLTSTYILRSRGMFTPSGSQHSVLTIVVLILAVSRPTLSHVSTHTVLLDNTLSHITDTNLLRTAIIYMGRPWTERVSAKGVQKVCRDFCDAWAPQR